MPIESLEDLAKRLGLSRRTVARVLQNDRNVAAATRERVNRFLARHDYAPNAQASRLAGGRVPVVGLVLPESFLLTVDDFVSRMIRGTLEAVHARGHQVTFHAFKTFDASAARRLHRAKMVGGLVFVAFGESDFEPLRALKRDGVPLAVVQMVCPGVDSFDCDNRRGGYLATRHLLSLGRHRVAFLHGDPNWISSQDRFQGYAKALREAGLKPPAGLAGRGFYSVEGGRRAVLDLLGSGAKPPDAIFAANDLMSLGACLALKEKGFSVPGDVAVIGFDDNPLCALPLLQTRLSSVRQQVQEMATAATEKVMDLMAGQGDPPPVLRLFEPALVARESTVAAR